MTTPEEQALTAPAHQGIMVEFGEKVGLDPKVLGHTLTQTIFPNATASPAQVYALLMVAKRYDLDPLLKQIYAFPAKGGGIVPIVGYDGMCTIANRHPQMDGEKTEWILDAKGSVIGCRATVWRKDRSHPTVVEELIAECKQDRSPVWKKHPTRMIRNRALTQAFRLAFGLTGIYLPDEAEQIRDAEYEVGDYGPAKSKAAQEIEAKLLAKKDALLEKYPDLELDLEPEIVIDAAPIQEEPEFDENGQIIPPLEDL